MEGRGPIISQRAPYFRSLYWTIHFDEDIKNEIEKLDIEDILDTITILPQDSNGNRDTDAEYGDEDSEKKSSERHYL